MLTVVAFLALLTVVVIQQMRLARVQRQWRAQMQRQADVHAQQVDQLTQIIRVQRDRLERQGTRRAVNPTTGH
jgi:hypothetical protein